MPAERPPALVAYRLAGLIATPLAGPLLALRQRSGREDPDRITERKGIAGQPRPAGPLIWLHGASIGELTSLLPLVGPLAARATVLVTTGTVTSAAVARRRLPDDVPHQYVPLDMPRFVARFLDHWRPDLALFAESELWPNLLLDAADRGVRLALVNARVSERSFRRWRRAPRAIGALLGQFAICVTQSEDDAERLRLLGAPGVVASGNLKFDTPPLPADEAALDRMKRAIGARPVWLAASTHDGEEVMLAAAQRRVVARHPDALLIVAPRHPERGGAVATMLRAAGHAVTQRSAGEPPVAATQCYVADTVGELGLFYRLSPLSFVGGSLVDAGGHNPIEPAALGSAILHGPHVRNFAEVYAALHAQHGATAVADPDDLGHAILRLLDDGPEMARSAAAARAVVAIHRGAADRTLQAIEPLLAAIPGWPS